MKAILLAGGYATRLHPLTLDQSKPLLQVAGKPIIEYGLEKLEKLDQIDEYFVVTNEKFYDHYLGWSQRLTMSKPLTIINDGTKSNEDRLGTLGDIQYTLDNYEITDDVLILGGDNLFTDSLENLLQTFERGSVIGLHDVGDLGLAQLFGNVTLDSNQKVIQFVEKPKNPSSTLISTLVWALRKDHLPLIKQTIQAGKNDHAGDLIAHICHDEDIYGIELEGTWFDIGTMKQYEKANSFFA